MLTVALDGSGDFRRIQDAVDSIAAQNLDQPAIFVKKGIYEEKLVIEKPGIKLMGEGTAETVIRYGDYALKEFPDGGRYGTFNSHTVFIGANDFSAEGLTFENCAGPGKSVGQAVAVNADADRLIFRNCRFLGHQDTLFTGPLPPQPRIPGSFSGPRVNQPRLPGRHYYENCFITGDIDFIFGSATAVFKGCELYSKERNEAVNGYITAASTPLGQPFGYVFLDCRLTGNAAPQSVFLGRPWRQYAKVVFINCWMGDHIRREGWSNWDNPENEGTVYFAEYNSTGPGGQTDARVSWANILTPSEAATYTVANVLTGSDGWNPLRM